MSPNSCQASNRPERRYDLDWLRVLAVLVLLYFHTAAIFYCGELGEFYVKNDRPSPLLTELVWFIHQWHMPLFFLLSGASTWFALSFRSPQQYLRERCLRLLLPFVFGTLILVPPQVYYRLRQSAFRSSFLQFYPQFFHGVRPEGNFEWGHLWFIIYLLVFSLIVLPLLLYFKRAGANWCEKLAVFVESRGVFMLALPLATIEGALRPRWIGFQNLYDDWANFCLYLLYFIYGYLLCSDQRFTQAIDRQWRTAIGLAILLMFTLFVWRQTHYVSKRDYSLPYVLYQMLRGVNSWFWVIALLGLGHRFLNFNSQLLQFTSEPSYPFYLLHQTVLVAIGFYVVQWHVDVMLKFWMISTATLVGTIALYALLIRRYNISRLLFGLKLFPKG
jgi:peptidoglycan/LPS O-acetylase OafA/YrhL